MGVYPLYILSGPTTKKKLSSLKFNETDCICTFHLKKKKYVNSFILFPFKNVILKNEPTTNLNRCIFRGGWNSWGKKCWYDFDLKLMDSDNKGPNPCTSWVI